MEGFSWAAIVESIWSILIILALTWVVLFVLDKLLDKFKERMLKKSEKEGEPPSESGKRVDTLMRLVRQGVRLVVLVVVALIVLGELGVQIGPILAGAGILGLAVGFGAQALVRDIIAGFFFIM